MGTKLKETSKQVAAFELYYKMERRSIKALAERLKLNYGRVRTWAERYNWQQRIEDLAEKERAAIENAHLKEVQSRTELHLKSYQLVQGKAVGYLSKRPDETAFRDGGDAVRALDTGIKGERELLGLTLPPGTVPGQVIGTTNIQNNITIALSEMAKNGQREVILRALKRVYKELTAGTDKGPGSAAIK